MNNHQISLEENFSSSTNHFNNLDIQRLPFTNPNSRFSEFPPNMSQSNNNSRHVFIFLISNI